MYLTYKNKNMNHVMVCADFPGATEEQATSIQKWLNQRNWFRLNNPGDKLNNVWYGTFNRQMLEQDCRDMAGRNFLEAAKQHSSSVKVTVLWSSHKSVTKELALIS